eukprot:12238706-Heterocapsa_arctica.AAC.1
MSWSDMYHGGRFSMRSISSSSSCNASKISWSSSTCCCWSSSKAMIDSPCSGLASSGAESAKLLPAVAPS